jgi:translation elongation factor EF-Ts
MERISILKKLRAKTQLPLNDCKKALEKANWDIKKAEEILKEREKSKRGNYWSLLTLQWQSWSNG